jgi:hypothetical protein
VTAKLTTPLQQDDPYAGLSREAPVAVLRRRDAQAHYGLVWERKDIDPDRALNRDFVGLSLDEGLSVGPAPPTGSHVPTSGIAARLSTRR